MSPVFCVVCIRCSVDGPMMLRPSWAARSFQASRLIHESPCLSRCTCRNTRIHRQTALCVRKCVCGSENRTHIGSVSCAYVPHIYGPYERVHSLTHTHTHQQAFTSIIFYNIIYMHNTYICRNGRTIAHTKCLRKYMERW